MLCGLVGYYLILFGCGCFCFDCGWNVVDFLCRIEVNGFVDVGWIVVVVCFDFA